MRIGDRDDRGDNNVRWADAAGMNADASANQGNPSAHPASSASRLPFGDLGSFGRARKSRIEPSSESYRAPPTDPSGIGRSIAPISRPALRLENMQFVPRDLPGPGHWHHSLFWRHSLYKTLVGDLWRRVEAPGPIGDTWVLTSMIYTQAGAAVFDCRHVLCADGQPTVALRLMDSMDTSLERLKAPDLSAENGVYEFHMLDKWLGYDTVGTGIGIDQSTERAIRFDPSGIWAYDKRGNKKPDFGLGSWAGGFDSAPTANPRTAAIFGSLPSEFMVKGVSHVAKFSDEVLWLLVNESIRGDERKKDETFRLLAARREKLKLEAFGSGSPSLPRVAPMESRIDPEDPAIAFLRHASWPPQAKLEFIKRLFPQAVFYVDDEDALSIIEPGSGRTDEYDAFGFRRVCNKRFTSVYHDLRDLSSIVLSHGGAAGWVETRYRSDKAYCASEATIIAAGDPRVKPKYIYAFVPDEKRSFFQRDPRNSSGSQTSRSFKPLLVIEAKPSDFSPSIYTLAEPSGAEHPYYWENLPSTTPLSEPIVFTPTAAPPTYHINGLSLRVLSAEELALARQQNTAANAVVDKRHPYISGTASVHMAGAVMLEVNSAVWLTKNAEGTGWGLPKQTFEAGSARPELALDAANKQLGLQGPVLGYIGDYDNTDTQSRTRYFIARRHCGSPAGTPRGAMLVSVDQALQYVDDPADRQALSALRSMLNPPSLDEMITSEEKRMSSDPAALEAYWAEDAMHPFVQLASGVGRIFSRDKISQPPKITHHRVTIDGEVVHYTAIRQEMYMPVPGHPQKPPIKMCSLEFVRDDAGPDEPTVIMQGGGPGASPAWFMGGGMGPIIVDRKTRKVVPNSESLLKGTRLLFIDSPGTGDSLSDGDEKATYHIDTDALITSDYIKRYRGHHKGRLKDSPLFLVGPSYATQRMAIVTEQLIEDEIPVGGVLFVSGPMSYQFVDFNPESIISHVSTLVAYSTAAYHYAKTHFPDMLDRYPDESEFLREVKEFAEGEYLLAIKKGGALRNEDSFHEIAKRISSYIRIDPEIIESHNLKVPLLSFCSSLLPTGETIAALDGRMATAPVPDTPEIDPFAYVLVEMAADYQEALTEYIRKKLNYAPMGKPKQEYVVLDPRYPEWNWGKYQNTPARVQDRLIEAARRKPHLRWFLSGGKHDLRSPAHVHEYAVNQLPPDVAERMEVRLYPGGHMFYMTDDASRKEFMGDMLRFIERQVASMRKSEPESESERCPGGN